MYDDDADDTGGPLRRLLGAPIVVAVVGTYVTLAAVTLVLRALYALGSDTLRSVISRLRRSGVPFAPSSAVSQANRMRFDEAP